MAVIFKNVDYIYNKDTPFENVGVQTVSFEIRKGFYALIGKTGSGKSTVLQLGNGILTPDKGEVLIDGMSTKIKKLSFDIKKRVGLSFQYPEDQFFEDTVLKEVAFAPKNFGVEEYNLKLRVKWAMDLVGMPYETYSQRHPLMLSGGQKRKIALASVLASKPKYLFLDEPTAGLDPESETFLLSTLKKLTIEEDVTVLISTHNLSVVDKYCNWVFLMNKGKIIMQGEPKTVFMDVNKMNSIGLVSPIKYIIKDKVGGIDVC